MSTNDLLKYEVKKYRTYNTGNDKEFNYPCFRLNKAVSYSLPELSFNEAVKLLDFIKESFKKDIGTCDFDIMYNHIQKYLNDNNINLSVNNVYDKNYSETFDEFLADNYLKEC